MIKPEQIPDVVIHTACEEYGGGHIYDMRHAIAAAINAWPLVLYQPGHVWGKMFNIIILPIPQEKNDD